MVVRHEKRSRKLRGSRRMGWGLQKQHRNRGKRGGRQIGMDKEKFSWTVKYAMNWYGKRGFVNPTTKVENAVSLRNVIQMILSGKLSPETEKNEKVYDLIKSGYDKLLGGGSPPFPIVVKTKKITEKAKRAIEEKGGKVILS
ncbi:50S ribosomal protein L15 [Sulfolobales archaeon HS-7]|nr:50S ribosomal protein L15 [Sulfolobales archaeon HS-7]